MPLILMIYLSEIFIKLKYLYFLCSCSCNVKLFVFLSIHFLYICLCVSAFIVSIIVCLSQYGSVWLFVYIPSLGSSLCQFVNPKCVCLLFHLQFFCTSIRLYVSLSFSLSLSVYPSVQPTVCISIRTSVYPSVCLSVRP